MKRFKVGDSARVVYIRTCRTNAWQRGIIVTIDSLYVGVFDKTFYECIVTIPNGYKAYVLLAQLEPITKGKQKTTWEAVEKATGWSPIKEKVT